MTTTAILYSRISDDREGTGAGVKRQHDDLHKLAKQQGWDVVGDFTDNDISAYNGKRRPGWEQASKAIETGDVDILAVWASDRLTRHPRELEDLVDLLERTSVTVSTVTSGEYDLTTPEGRAVARIVGAIARQESERKSVRIKAQYQQALKDGTVRNLSVRPFGYTNDQLHIVPAEAALIREGFQLIIDGGSLNDVWRLWRDSEITTTAGGEWSKHTTKRVLADPRYAGIRKYKGEPVGEAPWEGIVDLATFEKAQAIIKSRSNPDRRPNRKYLLTGGIARCGRCDAPMIARPTDTGKPAYICPPAAAYPNLNGCGKMKMLAEWLEGEVERQVLAVFDPKMLADAVAEYVGEIDAVEVATDIQQLEQALDELSADYYAERKLTRSQFDTAHQALTAKVEAARKSLVPPEASLIVNGDLGEWWEAAEVVDRRELVRLVVDRVVIAPGVRGRNTFDPSRISIDWI